MDAVALLREARACGLTVTADGDQLVVTGPKNAANVVRKLADNKPAVLAALRSPTDLSALSAVGKFLENAAKGGNVADADKQIEPPQACKACGGCIGWYSGRRVACWSCEPPPAGVEKLLLVDSESGPAWRRYDDERPAGVQPIDGLDPWEAALPWDESTPSCPTCKSAEGWLDALDRWHCLNCTPPLRAEKLLRDRERILQDAWRRLRKKK